MHDLDERRGAGSLGDGVGGPDDRAHLHLVDLGPLEAEPAAARAEHRVRLAELLDPAAHLLRGRVLGGRQELVERRVEETDRHRVARHRLEDPLEVRLLHRQQPVERRATLLLVRRQDHLLDDRQPVGRHEHVLGAAETDSLGAELACLRRVLGRVGVRAHAQAAQLVGPAEDRLEVLVDRGRHERHGAHDHAPGAPVDRQLVSLAQLDLADAERPCPDVDRERVAAGDARLAHAARDDRRVGGHAAVRGQHAPRVDEAVDVVRRRLPAHEDDVLAGPAALLGEIRVEHDRPRGRARRRVQSRRDDLDLRVGVDHRVEELVELARVDPGDGLLARDQPLVRHLDRDPQRRLGGALPGAGLQEVERAVLDGELDVLHLAVVVLEPLRASATSRAYASGSVSRMRSIGSGVRIPATTSSPCALTRNSPKSVRSPVDGSRVKQTPVPDVSPLLPNTIWTTLTAVPRSSGMS